MVSSGVADTTDRYASCGFRVLIYSHSSKLEGKESFNLVLDSLKGDRQVDLLIISSLVGRADGTSAAGSTHNASSMISELIVFPERLTSNAETNADVLEELRRFAAGKGWHATRVNVASSVEQALEATELAFKKQAGEWSHMSCLITGSSYLVAEALALLEVSGT